MSKRVLNYFLCFLAGSVFALSISVGFSDASSDWNSASFVHSGDLQEWLWALAPIWVSGILAIGATVLLSTYWNDAAALAGRVLRRAAVPGLPGTANPPAQPSRGQNDVNAVREELERQLGRLIVLIAGQLEKSQDHVASLRDANSHLASVTNVTELREVVRSLITKNETNERQTRDLETRLKEAQNQATVLRQRLTQAEKLASLDPLTSVANRRRFEQFISTEVNNSHADGTPLCLIMTDIDHFKKVNDTHGHSAGDRVLKAFADLLSRNVRNGDLVARYGGEEFAVVLPHTPTGDAFVIAERIRSLFELQGGPEGTLIKEFGRLTASFGIAEVREGEPPSALIQRADQMLYAAKDKGRNRTIIWSASVSIPARCAEISETR